MQFLALDKIQPGATPEKIQSLLREEAEVAWAHYKQGVIRQLFFRTDRPGAVVMMECDSMEEARGVLDALPLVKAGLVDFDIIPLGPFMPFDQFFSGAGHAPDGH